MIQANELRIGNWVYGDIGMKTTPPMIVKGINQTEVLLDIEGNEGDLFEEEIRTCTPIPLTEEILLKNGIGKYFDGQTEAHFNGDMMGDTRNRTNFVYYKLERSWFYKHFGREIPCKYVHKFQNIYFALYDEEFDMAL